MADNNLLRGTYSMLTKGFIRADPGTAFSSLDPRPDVVLDRYDDYLWVGGQKHYANVPEERYPVSEVPVLAGYIPSEQFPLAGLGPAAGTTGRLRPSGLWNLTAVEASEGLVQLMNGGNPAIVSGEGFLRRLDQGMIEPDYSGYEVDPDGRTARAKDRVQP